jgi:predicted nucleic acid-binding protein
VTALVIDSSVILASLFEEERTPKVLAIRRRVGTDGALVPTLWVLEIANVLLMAERRRRMTQAYRLASLVDLAALPIVTDTETGARAWNDTLCLAETHRLTVYDATYLELALRRSLPLASLDRDLCAAASARGVQLL